MPIAAILAFITTYLPQAISLGVQVAPLITSLKNTWNNIATEHGATAEDFAAFHALIKPYEDDLQAQADAAAAEIASAGSAGSAGT